MAKAKAVAIEEPMAGVKKAMDATAEAVKKAAKGGQKAVSGVVSATAKGVSMGLYYPFYATSFGVTFVLLTAFSLVAHNPIGNGIRDGVAAAAKIKTKKKK